MGIVRKILPNRDKLCQQNIGHRQKYNQQGCERSTFRCIRWCLLNLIAGCHFFTSFFSSASCSDVISSFIGLIQMWGGSFFKTLQWICEFRCGCCCCCCGRQDEETAWAPQVNSAGGSGLKPEKRQTVGFSDAALEVFDTNITRQTNNRAEIPPDERGRARKGKSLLRLPEVCLLCCCDGTKQFVSKE